MISAWRWGRKSANLKALSTCENSKARLSLKGRIRIEAFAHKFIFVHVRRYPTR